MAATLLLRRVTAALDYGLHAGKESLNHYSRPFNILDMGRPRDFRPLKPDEKLVSPGLSV